jgi:hypothetical protein
VQPPKQASCQGQQIQQMDQPSRKKPTIERRLCFQMYVYEKSSFKPQPQLWTALCYKADESADESKK